MSEQTIRILVTGGTMDKTYDQISGQLTFTTSHVQEILDQVRCQQSYALETLMLKDSLYFDGHDREIIRQHCRQSRERRLLITHGTDTMTDTARLLGTDSLDKTIVLTGAMVPLTFINSDGLFNLGFAFAAARLLPAGVYVAMNGRVFTWDNVRKNKELGEFEPLSP